MIVERRVVVLSRTGRLGTLALQALGDTRSLACFESPIDLADWARPPVDVVLMDFPRRDRGIVYRQLRQRYRGPVLALLDSGDDSGGLPEGRGPLATLQRPFSGEELSEVLGALIGPSTAPPAVAPPAPPPPVAPQAGSAVAPPAVPAPQAPPPVAPPAPPAPVPVASPVPPTVAPPAPPPEARPAARPPEAAPRVPASATPAEAVTARRRTTRWRPLRRPRPRRWHVALGAAALVLLALSLGAPGGCGSRCASVAGAVETGTPGGLAPDLGMTADPPTGSGVSAGPTTGTQASPGAPTTTPAIGLLTSVGGTGISSLLISPAGGMGGTNPLLPTSSAPGAPPPTPGATPTTAPPATQPPTTAPPPTSPPTTAPPPTSPPPTNPPTTAPPPTSPPTTAPPPTDPPTTAPPPTEPPTTAPPP